MRYYRVHAIRILSYISYVYIEQLHNLEFYSRSANILVHRASRIHAADLDCYRHFSNIQELSLGTYQDFLFNLEMTDRNCPAVQPEKYLPHLASYRSRRTPRDVVTEQKLKDFASKYAFKNYTLNVFIDVYEETGIINFAQINERSSKTHKRPNLTGKANIGLIVTT